MRMGWYMVWLLDEAPRIGSGLRLVSVEAGRKWVRLSDAHGHHARLPIKAWEDILSRATSLPQKDAIGV